MLERRSEIGLMMAIGYRKKQIFRLILTENLFLLVIGLICGLASAFIGILPSILSLAFTMPTWFISILVLIVFISGVIWIYFLIKNTLKGNIIRGLREEGILLKSSFVNSVGRGGVIDCVNLHYSCLFWGMN